MRRCVALLCVTVGFSTTAGAEDLTTLTGRTYSNIEVQQVKWDSLLIKHDAGIAKVFYTEIPPEQRDHLKSLKVKPVLEENPAAADPQTPVGSNDLLTVTGQLYQNVAVRRVEPDAVLIGHDGGLAKIPFSEIPPAVRDRFQTPTRLVPETPPGTNDLVDANGRIYRNAQVRKIEPDGLTLQHDAGLTKVAFLHLSEEIRQKYEYDPQAAKAYRKSMLAAKKNAAREEQAIRKQNQAARRKQIQAEPIRVFEVICDKVDRNKYRVRFSVHNYDDKPLEITASTGLLGIKQFTIPANTTKSGLEVISQYGQPTKLSVSSGSYSTQTILHW